MEIEKCVKTLFAINRLPNLVLILLRDISMSIDDYKRQLDAQALQSHGKLSPFRELLEQLFDMIVRLDRKAYLRVGSNHRLGDIGGYRNGYNPDGATNASGSLNFLPSQTSSSVNTPLYPSANNRGQRISEALLNAVAECYIEGFSTRDSGKILEQFGIESMSSTQQSNTNEKLDEGFEPWRHRGLEEFSYLILNAGYEKLRLKRIFTRHSYKDPLTVSRGSDNCDISDSLLSMAKQIHLSVRDFRKLIECSISEHDNYNFVKEHVDLPGQGQ